MNKKFVIRDVEVFRGRDGYCIWLEINPNTGNVWVYPDKRYRGGSDPRYVYLPLDYDGRLYPDEVAVREFLESSNGQEVLNKIVDGDSFAILELRDKLRKLPETKKIFWGLDDWMPEPFDFVGGDTTDKEVEKIAHEIIDTATENDILDFTVQDVVEFLKKARSWLLERRSDNFDLSSVVKLKKSDT